MTAALLALATAVPSHIFQQSQIASQFIDTFSIKGDKASALKKTYDNSAIHQRHSVLGDFLESRENWEFWGPNYPESIPGMSQRNLRYKEEAPKIALIAAKKALQAWGGSASQITHIISVSCTGVMAPGIEFLLMQELELPQTANRLGINFMGCFGAFKGLSVARAFALENPKNRVLLICTELCSLHLQAGLDMETLIGNSLFSDGAAAAIIGTHPQKEEVSLWNILRMHSMGIENTLGKITWEAGDTGFFMHLSHQVPVLIRRHIQTFANQLMMENPHAQACDWAIHPGGKSILQAVEKGLQLDQSQTTASWEILSHYGNMSSATFLFVLDRLAQQTDRRPWTAGLAFGPGLSFEGMLLEVPQLENTVKD